MVSKSTTMVIIACSEYLDWFQVCFIPVTPLIKFWLARARLTLIEANLFFQQTFIVEYVVNHQMCDECRRVEAKDLWSAMVRKQHLFIYFLGVSYFSILLILLKSVRVCTKQFFSSVSMAQCQRCSPLVSWVRHLGPEHSKVWFLKTGVSRANLENSNVRSD